VYSQQDAEECWSQILQALCRELPAVEALFGLKLVGLYELNPSLPIPPSNGLHKPEYKLVPPPGFNPCAFHVISWLFKFILFKIQVVLLHAGDEAEIGGDGGGALRGEDGVQLQVQHHHQRQPPQRGVQDRAGRDARGGAVQLFEFS
jgi:hypothetical protein